MNIGKAADQAGLPTKTVRYYADIGLVLPSSRTQTCLLYTSDAADE